MEGFAVRVKSIELSNFGSYKNLEFKFNNQGLTLIQGPTGSGKSTLCDAIPWVLFGKTAKGGSVDEIRAWLGGDTKGTIYLHNVTIVRTRGKTNDLHFWQVEGTVIRGKDIPDTQRLINGILGFDYETYLSAAYFHEFSQTAQFFTTSAKNRRIITEQLADLSLAANLQEKTGVGVKESKQKLADLELEISKNAIRFEHTLIQQEDDLVRAHKWSVDQQKHRNKLLQEQDNFDAVQEEKLEALLRAQEDYMNQARNLPVCSECGAIKKANHIHNIVDPYQSKIDALLAAVNTYPEQISYLDSQINPFGIAEDITKKKLIVLDNKDNELLVIENTIKTELLDLELLKESLQVHRNQILTSNIEHLQNKSNDLLTRYFDAEIRVEFIADGADKLEVLITKDGNQASYTQLSKGQRQILKLCFAIAVMEAISNQKGVHFDQLFFDEALSGMDDNIKAKAFNLLESLSLNHKDVFIVEHSEGMKQLFNTTISVSLENGQSQLCQN